MDDVPVLIRLAPMTSRGVVNPRTGRNRVELRCIGSTISATINGTEVASARDTTYSAGRMWIGATVDPNVLAFGHALFDNLLIRGVPATATVAAQPHVLTEPPVDGVGEAD
jgi:hypothetical protein